MKFGEGKEEGKETGRKNSEKEEERVGRKETDDG